MGLNDFLKKKKEAGTSNLKAQVDAARINTKSTPSEEPSPEESGISSGKLSGFLKGMKDKKKFDNPLSGGLTKEQVEKLEGVDTRDVTLGQKKAIVSSTSADTAHAEEKEVPLGKGPSELKLVESIAATLTEELRGVKTKVVSGTTTIDRQIGAATTELKKAILALDSRLTTMCETMEDLHAKIDSMSQDSYAPTKVASDDLDSDSGGESGDGGYDAEGIAHALVDYITKEQPTRKSDILDAVASELGCQQLEVSEVLTELMDADVIGKDGRNYVVVGGDGSSAASPDESEDADDLDIEAAATHVWELYSGLQADVSEDEFVQRCMNILGGQFSDLTEEHVKFLVGPDGLAISADGTVSAPTE